MRDEMTALHIEVSSIAASGQQLKKPIKVPRPAHIKRNSHNVRHADSIDAPDPYKKAVGVLAATTRGAVRR